MDPKVGVCQKPCVLERTSTEMKCKSQVTSSDVHFKSEVTSFTSVFVVQPKLGIINEDNLIQVKAEPKCMETTITELQAQSEETHGTNVCVNSELASFASVFMVEPDSSIRKDEHKIDTTIKIKEEPEYLETISSELKPESEEIHFINVDLHINAEDHVSEENQEFVLPDSTRSKGLSDEEIHKLLVESDDEVYSDFSDLEESDVYLSDENIESEDHDSESELEAEDGDDLEEQLEVHEFFIGKDKVTHWCKSECANPSKTKRKNIVKILPGPKRNVMDITDEVSAFLNLIDLDIIDEIINHTNMYIVNRQQDTHQFSHERDNKVTSRQEIMAVLGILFFIGTRKGHHANVKELWAANGTGLQLLRATMSYKRFLFLLRCMQFDDMETRNERRKTDKLAAIRTVLEAFVANCQNSYSLGEFTIIDEMLHPFRGHCGWIQYMPSKPAKYGIKMFALCDAKTFYCSNLEVYCGIQPEGQYHVSNAPEDIVKRLVVPIENSNRNLTTDNWYTSYPLAEYLLQKKITYLGTMRKNRHQIPPEFLPNKTREIGTALFGFQKDKTLVSYVPRKNCAVVLLSTMHDTAALDEKTCKPEIITDYNITKGGVDVVDKMCASYSVSRITRRWPLAVFFILLNIAGINSQVLFSFTKPETTSRRRIYLRKLAECLMKEQLSSRAQLKSLPADLTVFLTQFRREALNSEDQILEPPAKKRGTCSLCGRQKNSSTTIKCDRCRNFACKNHTMKQIVCVKCCVSECASE